MESIWDGHRKFVTNALDCVKFRLVRRKGDFEKEDENDEENPAFAPEFANQPFGQNELIMGYRDLSVRLYFLACSMHCMLEVKYREKMKPTATLEPTDIKASMAPYMPKEYTEDPEEFASLLREERAPLYGSTVCSYEIKREDETSPRKYYIQRCDLNDSNFAKLHHRLETFVFFFIDGASRIIVEEGGWEVFITFEKLDGFDSKKGKKFAPIGLCTMYKFYAYPDRIRPRISQLLILPPFQRQGHGTKLVEAVYKAFNSPDVKDITVESPNEDFIFIRDCILARKCSKLEEFQPKKLLSGFTEKMYKCANVHTKGSLDAIRRVYYILRVAAVIRSKLEDSPEEIKAHLRAHIHRDHAKEVSTFDRSEKNKYEEQLTIAVEENYLAFENTAKALIGKNEI